MMPPSRVKDNIPDEDETEDSPVPIRVHEENAIEQPDLNKTGGRMARWFKSREASAPTKPSDPVETIPSISRVPKTAESQNDGEPGDEESLHLGSTAASSSKPKKNEKTQPQNIVDKPKRRRSTSDHSSDSRKVRQPRSRRRSSTSKSSRRPSKEIPEGNSERGGLRLILETQEDDESVKKLEEEMSEKLDEIREITKSQKKKNVDKESASGITSSPNDDKDEAETPQKLEEEKRKFTEKVKSELEEEMKAKAEQTKTHIETMRIKLKSDYATQAKAMMQEHEKKMQRELKPALAAAKNKVRKEAAEEALLFETFIRAQVTQDCEKIDEEYDQRIDAINRERKERQLAVRQKGQEAIESRRKTPQIIEQLDEKVKSAYNMLELSEKERLQKNTDTIEADLARREALDISALEREAEQKLDLTRTILEEQSRQKLKFYSAEIEPQADDRIKPKKDPHGKGENSKTPELSTSQTLTSDDSDRPQRSLIEEELLLREAKKSQKTADSDVAPVLKTSLKTSSAPKVGKKVLFEKSQREGNEESCSCIKQGHFACIPFVDSAVEIFKQTRDRPRGRSFAQPHSRESIFARVAGKNIVYENSHEDPRNETTTSASATNSPK